MDVEQSEEHPRESQKNTRQKCIIHSASTDSKERLISPQSFSSWSTLLAAAVVRNHDPILQLAQSCADGEIPDEVFYHRQCRACSQ